MPKKTAIAEKLPAPGNQLLYQLAFENSILPNLVATTGGKIILANKAACQLLGYPKKELLTLSQKDIMDVQALSFKKMLSARRAAGQATAFVTMIKKNGSRIPCEITSALFENKEGLGNVIITISDMRQQLESQKIIDTKKDKLVSDNIARAISKQKQLDVQKARIVADDISLAKTRQQTIDVEKARIVAANIFRAISKQLKIDVAKEKIVADNIALAILKQQHVDSRNAKIVADNILLAIAKQLEIDVKKEKIVAENIVLAITKQIKIDAKNGRIVLANIALAKSAQVKIDVKNKKRVDDNILVALAKSNEEKQDYEEATRGKLLVEFKKKFKLIFNSSAEVLYDSNLLTGEVIISNAFEKEFGYKIRPRMSPQADWIPHIHPDDQERVGREYARLLKSRDTEWKAHYRFLRANGSVADVLSSCIVLRDTAGKPYRLVGSMQDLSKEKLLEDRIQQEIILKELQIAEAMKDAKDTERADIGMELHDNINQLLVASRLYLEMAKTGGPDSQLMLSRSSEYTHTAIEEIRKLTRGLTTNIIKNLGLGEAINNMVQDTMEVAALRITTNLSNFNESGVNDKFKLALFRIIQEQLNNILKHAQAQKVSISLLQNKKLVRLVIKDDGIGFDISQKKKGIGMANIRSRADAYNGVAEFVSKKLQGCTLTVSFQVNEVLLKC